MKSDALTTLAANLPRPSPRLDRAQAMVELGVEPPIRLGDHPVDSPERRRISLRWLAGAALTGLSGVALIGSALYLGLDSQYNFASAPEFASAANPETGQSEGVSEGKGDRLLRPVDIVAAKQTFKVATTIKIGDKEVVKFRSFTHLQTTLTTTPTGYADAVPPFNPLKLTSGASAQADAAPDSGPVQDDAEVSFREHDFDGANAVRVEGDLSLADAQAQVAELMKAAASASQSATPLPQQFLLTHSSQANPDPFGLLGYATVGNVGPMSPSAPFASIEVRMVPENVTNVAKATPADEGTGGERLVRLRHGETFEDLLRANGASKEAAAAILAAFGAKRGESPVDEGQKIILLYEDPLVKGAPPPIGRVSVYADEQLKAAVALDDEGDYAPLTQRKDSAPRKVADDEGPSGGMTLYQSLYETALKQGLSRPIIDELVRVFGNDVDYQRATASGDSIEAFLSEPDEIDPHPELLFATMTVRDQIFKYYRFETPDDGLVDYYDENGRSTRKFLLRKPIAEGVVTSPFGMRYHPILRYARMHTGVDWAAPFGTPVLAAGSGVIIKAAYDSGYGRRVEIQHANGYVTTYNHMSGFGRGIVEGVHVAQGQIVGYLGQTGLATGPHLHYEVIINGNFVDPMAIKLARTREFDGKMLAAFKRERERIDQLMAQAPSADIDSTSVAAPPAAKTAKVN